MTFIIIFVCFYQIHQSDAILKQIAAFASAVYLSKKSLKIDLTLNWFKQ